jgi:transketolase
MRALPTMGVFQPMDARETELLMDYLVEKWKGPAYIRLTRQNLPPLMPHAEKLGKWEAGKVTKLREGAGSGKKVVLFGSGAGTAEAMGAADLLAGAGFSVSVWNVHSLKPFDEKGAIAAVQGADLVATVEDHSVIGGLGACVAEALASLDRHARLVKFGVQDEFGQSGEPDELYDLYGISAKKVAESIRKQLG